MNEQIIINALISASFFSLVALSFGLIYRVTNFFNISFAINITLSAYIFSHCNTFFPSFLSILFTLIISILLSLILEVLIYKPIRSRSSNNYILLLASLGIYIVFQNVISLLWGNELQSINSITIKQGYNFINSHITKYQIIVIAITAFSILFISILLDFSKLGRRIKAISSNQVLSQIFGISKDKVILVSLTISSIIGSSVGILFAYNSDFTVRFGFDLLIYGVIVMIISGFGNNWYLIVSSLFLAIAQHIGAYYIDSKWMDAIAYIILILFLLWKPLGLSGKRLKKIEI